MSGAVPFPCRSLVPPLLVLALLGLCLSLRSGPEIWPCSFLLRHAFAIFGFTSLISFFIGWPTETCLLYDRSHFEFVGGWTVYLIKAHALQCVACKLRPVLVPLSAPIWLVFIHTTLCQDRRGFLSFSLLVWLLHMQ